jgi:D-alanyl-D-alanine carboxypeptidase
MKPDRPVRAYLADLRGAERYTVRQALGHRTGLVAYQTTPGFAAMGGFGDPSRAWRPRELVALVEDLPLDFAPDSRFAYSNTNFIVAGMIAEQAEGRDLAVGMRERVFAPAEMDRTWLAGVEPVPEPLVRGYSTRFEAAGHLLASPGPLTDVTDALHPSVAWATGALVSSAPQVARFFERLLAGRIVAPASVAAMTTSPDAPDAASAYGLGLWRYGSATNRYWGHSGDTAGYLSLAVGRPDGGTVVVVLCNDDHDPDGPRAVLEDLGALVPP